MWKPNPSNVHTLQSYTEQGRTLPVGRYLLRREISFIRQFLGDTTRQNRLVDLCCGNGWIGLRLQQEGFPVLGLDIDWKALDTLQQRSRDMPLVQSDCLCLPFTSSSLGCIVAIHCFDHLNRLQFLRECRRVLIPAGLLIFDALNRHSYKLILKRLGRRTSIKSWSSPLDKYINVFSWDEIQQAVVGAGFDVQAASGYGWIPFSVNSDSELVNPAEWIERLLRLNLFISASPRVLIAARKQVNR